MTRNLSLGLAAAALLLAAPAQAQREVNVRHDATAGGTVEIQMNQGSLRVTGWSRREVQVTGSVARPGDRVELDGGGGSVEVRVAGRSGSRGGPATLEVRVPAGSTVEVTAGSAPITISGVTGSIEVVGGQITVQGSLRAVEAVSHSGGITVEGQTDRLNVTSMSGGVRVTANVRQRAEVVAMSGPVDLLGSVNELELTAMSGPVRVANAGGRVEIEAVSGGVSLNGSRLRGNVQSVSGNVVVGGTVGGPLSVESHSGDVELRLPGGAAAEVEVTTYNGGFRSDFGNGRGSSRERHVTIGRGGPAVSITTFSGDVKLTRR
ncbi:MAG TPA: DUF4097 family beta strand repeat-containing protein [Longimicrobium sp.]|nr:DUF4097 family beta strand repeat-containing protein [Longimicrobium sp.]